MAAIVGGSVAGLLFLVLIAALVLGPGRIRSIVAQKPKTDSHQQQTYLLMESEQQM